jgi:hypothetical protein
MLGSLGVSYLTVHAAGGSAMLKCRFAIRVSSSRHACPLSDLWDKEMRRPESRLPARPWRQAT